MANKKEVLTGEFVVTRIMRWNIIRRGCGKRPWIVELCRRQPAPTWWVMLAADNSAAGSKLCNTYGGRKVRVQYRRMPSGYCRMYDIELMD